MKAGADRRLSTALWALSVILALGAGAWLYGAGLWSAIPAALRRAGAFGVAASYVLVLAQTVIPFAPFVFLAGFNASAHGFWIGYGATWAGAFTGAMLLYSLARGPLRRYFQRYFRQRLQRFFSRRPKLRSLASSIGNQSAASAFLAILTLRMQPWLPSSAIDILSGLSGVPWRPYILATIAGQGPMIAMEVLIGHRLLHLRAAEQDLWWLAAGSAALFGGHLAVRKIFRRHRERGGRRRHFPN